MLIRQTNKRIFPMLCGGISLLFSTAFAVVGCAQETEIETPEVKADITAEAEEPAEQLVAEKTESEVVPVSSNISAAADSSVAETVSDEAALPNWISQGNFRAENGTEYLLVVSDAELDVENLEENAKQKMVVALKDYVDAQLESGASAHLNINENALDQYIVPGKTFVETKGYSIGEMYHRYDQLRISPDQRAELAREWTSKKSLFRLLQTSLIGAGVLATLVITFCFLRFNHATRGLHAGRLQFICGLAVIALAVAGIYAGKMLPWY